MWTAKITNIVSDPTASVAKVTIHYENTDGRSKDVIERISEPEAIKQIAYNGVHEFERIDAINEMIKNPVLGDIKDPTPTPESQDDIDFRNFQRWLGLVQMLASAKQLGWITGNEQVVLDAKAKVMALGAANIPKLFN